MKHSYLLLILGLTCLVGCKELTCDFSYSPSMPCVGQTVVFTNQSSGADDFDWSFGDNSSSTTGSPTHIYKKPGKYTVTLWVKRDKVQKKSISKDIYIVDTVPTIAYEADSIFSYLPIKIYAQYYNPWDKPVSFKWDIQGSVVVTAGKSLDSSAFVCYFTEHAQQEQSIAVTLDITIGDRTTHVRDIRPVYRQPAPSVLYQTDGKYYEQRFYSYGMNRLYQWPAETQDAYNISQLLNEQDSVFQYGDSLLTTRYMEQVIGQPITGFQVDQLAGKMYGYNNNGLWVVNINGRYPRQINTDRVQAIKVDAPGNRIYWATKQGLFTHRLVEARDNTLLYNPQRITEKTSITRISTNNNIH